MSTTRTGAYYVIVSFVHRVHTMFDEYKRRYIFQFYIHMYTCTCTSLKLCVRVEVNPDSN